MRGNERSPRRRNTLYVKQNKAYQMLLATLIIAFMLVTAVVMIGSGVSRPNATWRDNILIRMIIENNSSRTPQNQ